MRGSVGTTVGIRLNVLVTFCQSQQSLNSDKLMLVVFGPEPNEATLLPQQGKAGTLTPTAQLSHSVCIQALLPCSESKAAETHSCSFNKPGVI